jgi:restriction system protein
MYQIELSHRGLNRFRVIKGATPDEVEAKAQAQHAIWESMYQRHIESEKRRRERDRQALNREKAATLKEQQVQLATDLTQDAERSIVEAQEILAVALREGPLFDWENLKDPTPFQKPKPLPPDAPAIPKKPDPSFIPPKPNPDDARFQPQFSLLDSIVPGQKQRRIEYFQSLYESALATWKAAVGRYNEQVALHNKTLTDLKAQFHQDKEAYKLALTRWQAELAAYEARRSAHHRAVEERRLAYQNHDTDEVLEFCESVLLNSTYPAFCPRLFDCAYESSTRMLIVEFQLPSIDDVPSRKSAKYDRTHNKITYTQISQSALNKLYEDINYQIVLRTLHELFHADSANALDSIVFNGFVSTIDKATGQAIKPCIMSIQVSRSEFDPIKLDQVEPKACFRKLKGVSAAKLQALAPVAPVAQINREDKRFVESYDVAASLDDSENLASMDWEDFEHLIRELFGKEFAAGGGEVKVTQASRDDGVDAVAFDPDPIRGGKIVIQAKRYTNVVGVSAVRDLYGTVINEGAIKGILVTTSHYGADAFEFAKGKPLTLFDGGNLLSLLAKHGHRAKIDLKEAKIELASRNTEGR